MVLFSAGAGQQALDRLNERDGNPNGVFTRVLLEEMKRPGVPLNEMVFNVRQKVYQIAGSVSHEQVPAIYDQSLGQFYFQPAAISRFSAPVALEDPDKDLWEAVDKGGSEEDYQVYIRQFPQGKYRALAEVRLARLKRASDAQSKLRTGDVVAPASAGGFNVDDITSVRLAAERGNAIAQFTLGKRYYYGQDVVKDLKESVRWYRLSADQGYAKAQTSLGFAYTYGLGVAQDDKAAVRWYRLAAVQGQATAQNNLGSMYGDGSGVEKDEKEAVRWYRLATDQGEPSAQYNLGVMYVNGRGVVKDDNEAVGWFRLGADQGHAKAQYNLGVLYAKGRGVAKDDNEAARWYQLAADQGYAAAQFAL